MTDLLRALTGLLAALPRLPLVQMPIHIGPTRITNQLVADEPPCDCDDDEADLHSIPGVAIYPLPAPVLRGLFEEVAIARGNGASVDEAADTGFATLLLANVEATEEP